MNAPWHASAPRAPSADFAARVARAARKEYVARRARKIGAGVSVLALAAAAALYVHAGHRAPATPPAAAPPSEPLIVPDEPRVLPGSIQWPLTQGWGDEVYAFPLPFAPSLPYKGAVAIHFAPTFAKAGTEGYWSYVVAWVKAGVPAGEQPDVRGLEDDLRAYYTGLCGQSGHPGTHTRSPGFASEGARLAPAELDASDRAAGAAWAVRGEVETVDCVVTGGEIALEVEAVGGACKGQVGFVAYALSPRSFSDPIWGALREERRAFDCRHRLGAEAIAAITTPPAAPPSIPDSPAGRALSFVLASIARAPTEAEVNARVARTLLSRTPARKYVAMFEQLGGVYAPPIVDRVTERSAETLIVSLHSGKPDAPILGRGMTVVIGVDPKDPSRLSTFEDAPEGDAGAARP